jgi:hypothetical protein
MEQRLCLIHIALLTGLYIRSRNSEIVKVSIPADCIAFQIGETAQIHSGGILQVWFGIVCT